LLIGGGGAGLAAFLLACQEQAVPIPTRAPEPTKPAAPAATSAAPAARPAQGAPGTRPAEAPKAAAPAAAATATPAPAAAKPAEAGKPTPLPNVTLSFGEVKEVPRNETLIISVSDTINQMTDSALFNPFVPGSLRTGWHFAFEPLLFYNPWWTKDVSGPAWIPDAREGEIPYLATGYEYRNNNTEVLVKLRPKVEWSDGKPFTANDVVFTLNMLKQTAPKLNFSFDVNRRVKAVEAANELTVRIVLSEPDINFMFEYFLWHQDAGFPIVAEHVFKDQDPLTFTHLDPSKGYPVVTGPWKIVHSSPEQKIFDRRDDWWGAKSGFRRLPAMKRVIVLPHFEDPKITQLLSAGQMDTGHNLQPPDTETALQRNTKLKLFKVDNAKPYGWLDWWTNALSFNCSKPPFDDPEVRWAVNYAINRKQIVDVGFKGDTQETTLPFPFYTPMLKYFDAVKDLLEKYPIGLHDPAKSGQIMQSKGYAKDGEGFWAKAGKRLEMLIIHPPGFFQSFLPVLVQQLRQAGFDASFKSPTNAGTITSTGEADVFLGGHAGSLRDPYLTLTHYHGRYWKPLGEAAQFPYRWRNADFDKLVDELGKTTPSDKSHMELYHKAMEIWIPNLPDVPTVQWYLIVPSNAQHWKGWPDEKNPYVAPTMWHRGSATLVINSLEPA
jgi:peptide/nickel transport system substrate-binding protein